MNSQVVNLNRQRIESLDCDDEDRPTLGIALERRLESNAADDYPMSSLIDMYKRGELRLPEIQRH